MVQSTIARFVSRYKIDAIAKFNYLCYTDFILIKGDMIYVEKNENG